MIGERAITYRPSVAIDIAATNARAFFGVQGAGMVDMLEVFENLWDQRLGHLGGLGRSRPEAHLPVMPDVLPREDLAGASARTLYDARRDLLIVALAEDTYKRLEQGDPEARIDVAHEIGHAALHEKEVVARGLHGPVAGGFSRNPDEWNVEAQAEQFALVFLAPTSMLRGLGRGDLDQVMRRFGLSYPAARNRMALLTGGR